MCKVFSWSYVYDQHSYHTFSDVVQDFSTVCPLEHCVCKMGHKLNTKWCSPLFCNFFIQVLPLKYSVGIGWFRYWKLKKKKKVEKKIYVCRPIIFFEYGRHLTPEEQICFCVQFFLKKVIFCETVDKQYLGVFAKLRKATAIFVVSVCPHETNCLPLVGFSWNLIFRDLSKICWENSSFIKIWGEKLLLYMSVIISR